VLRYFNAAGADPDAQIGEDHNPETHLIPLAIDVALGRRDELHIFGDDYPTPDGTAVRDYVHVVDLATAHVRALKLLEGPGSSASCNLGTGCGYSVREIVAAVEQATGCTINQCIAPRRAGDPPALVAAPGRAGELLDWQPSCSDLDTIVRSAVRWSRRLAGGRRPS
jgi:UDP-arabinose 4-epimerase